MNKTIDLAIIGGSGLYQFSGLESVEEHRLVTPFGAPSAPVLTGRLEGRWVAFLARHGIGHTIMPSDVNYRANIYALKLLGAGRVVSISACGSLREDYAPGHIVIPDQLFDHTKNRQRTFFDDGLVAHIGVADPYCPILSGLLEQAVRETGAPTHQGGSFITVEGPRFSTRAESNCYRAWGMSIIGMTASPEAFLAREAEMCYSIMAHVTDYDVWHTSEAPVSVEMVIQTLNRNTQTAQQAIRNLLHILPGQVSCGCDRALASALITDRPSIQPATRRKLDLLVRKYL
ncbi:MAG: S-methyl-5'-thioadenosine phosphorylase [Chloroflexi bacterium]|nr:S-methyl-5'-thioadenosine phosphorylase [Chloroflexota bacterium]